MQLANDTVHLLGHVSTDGAERFTCLLQVKFQEHQRSVGSDMTVQKEQNPPLQGNISTCLTKTQRHSAAGLSRRSTLKESKTNKKQSKKCYGGEEADSFPIRERHTRLQLKLKPCCRNTSSWIRVQFLASWTKRKPSSNLKKKTNQTKKHRPMHKPVSQTI